MKKNVCIIMICLIWVNFSVCNADAIPLNDQITIENFVSVFNNSYDAKQSGVRIVGYVREPRYSENAKRLISAYETNNGVNIMINSSISSRLLYEIGVIGEIPSSAEGMKPILMTTMLVEKALGKPSGEGQATGMFAIMDAWQKGKGSYWSNETNRKYIVSPIKVSTDMIGFMIQAGI